MLMQLVPLIMHAVVMPVTVARPIGNTDIHVQLSEEKATEVPPAHPTIPLIAQATEID